MRLDPKLVGCGPPRKAHVNFNACLIAHGLYNSEQFVLRLSPEVHRHLAAMPQGTITTIDDPNAVQAYSTYLHETVHWWQHIGSTIGLMLSLSYPSQAHTNYSHLLRFLKVVGPKKSILRWVEANAPMGGSAETPAGIANTVVNNYFDIEFFRSLVTTPDQAQEIVSHQLFDCIGYSYNVTYANAVANMADTFDKDFAVLDNPSAWEQQFAELRRTQARGYYYGSPITLSPIGVHQLFEGQARFSQLQFLYFASGGQLTWADARGRGMLAGVYGQAFEAFLTLTKFDWPARIDDPVVALFLLVCDLAINPGAAFPMPLASFATFVEDVDPGIRFLFLCRTIAKDERRMATAIKDYSRSEYLDLSSTLTKRILVDAPLTITSQVASWRQRCSTLDTMMLEYQSFDYDAKNLPVRLLLTHFVAFCEDKRLRPEFFCWPGAWMVGGRVTQELADVFERQSAPFVDRAEDSGIYPRVIQGRAQEAIQRTFDRFYAANFTYDMTRQWIVHAGPFTYDYRSLSSSASAREMKEFADRYFAMAYEAGPDSFELL